MIKEFQQSGIKSGQAECIHLDLESFQSVRKFAKTFQALGTPLHVLVNNGR